MTAAVDPARSTKTREAAVIIEHGKRNGFETIPRAKIHEVMTQAQHAQE